MKHLIPLLALSVCAPMCADASSRHAPKGWKNYDGPMFSVFYPANWKARSGSDPDAAFFSSPKESVQFAVYSPQWNGLPKELNLDPRREKLVATRVQKSGGGEKTQIVTRWQTFRALDGAYTRSLVDVEDVTLGTRRAFVFRYKGADAYKRFLPDFKFFKASLEQYSD